MSATCTHLGCQVQWDGEGKKFKCPCHGGVYSHDGSVVSGPPAATSRRRRGEDRSRRRFGAGAAVRRLLERIGLANWLDSRTGFRAATSVMLDEPLPPGTGWFFTLGSILLALLSIQLLTGAFLTLYYAPTPDHAYDSVRFITNMPAGTPGPRPSSFRRQLHRRGDGRAHAARHRVRIVQAAARSDVAVGPCAPRPDPRVRADRLPAAVGPAGVLGHGRHDQHREAHAGGRRDRRRDHARRIHHRGADADALVLRARHLPARRTRRAWSSAHMVFMRRQGISGPVTPRSGPHDAVLSRPGVSRHHDDRAGRWRRSPRWRGAACRRSRGPPIRPMRPSSPGRSGIFSASSSC